MNDDQMIKDAYCHDSDIEITEYDWEKAREEYLSDQHDHLDNLLSFENNRKGAECFHISHEYVVAEITAIAQRIAENNFAERTE